MCRYFTELRHQHLPAGFLERSGQRLHRPLV
ncbi:hypothetical protein CSPAE12_01799 [Colletotrichum incanum]|nr:hypothetical protein CSPAE12_01799 [Colletotrichum incanum]